MTDDGGETGPLLEPVVHGRIGAGADRRRSPRKPTNQTADLLEALRRRRGERDPMDPEHDEPIAAHPSTGEVKLIDVPMDSRGSTRSGPPGRRRPARRVPDSRACRAGSRKNRTSMPSWDEIVFGARTDED